MPFALIRLSIFLIAFCLVAFWEVRACRRPATKPKTGRWLCNLAMATLNTLILRTILPGAAITTALLADRQNWGLLQHASIPGWLAFSAAIILLDLMIYLQHLMFHAVPALWRLHMVHHADADLDLTTGIRFHPLEMILSMLIKMAAVSVLGPPVTAVLVFEILLNGTALFNHGNIALPKAVEAWLRLLVVTPDMHRVHHSVLIRETNSNFGFNFPWWDRLLGTYRAQPMAGHLKMTIGLSTWQGPDSPGLIRLLVLPLTGPVAPYSLDHIGANPNRSRTTASRRPADRSGPPPDQENERQNRPL